MTRRYWFYADRVGGYHLAKLSGGGPVGSVTVRAAEPDIPHDGIWINGERSSDTEVLIEGEVAYHTPEDRLSRWSFDKHESRGGGHPLP